MAPLARYTVELDRPDGGWATLQRASEQARQAAEQMRREGTPVRFLRSIFVPEDDTCFFLYEAPTAADARSAARRAQLTARHVRKTITANVEP
jgi:Nickel responsive protein SCO4226-like